MILNQQRKVRIARGNLESFLRRMKKELGIAESDVTVCFVSDAEIARMNRQYRKKNGPTDVLSFPATTTHRRVVTRRGPVPSFLNHLATRHSPLATSDSYLGDIAIAPKTARRYAKKNGRSLDSELRVLMLHGVLHLLGYDHETDRGQMNRLENKLRRRFGLL